MNINTVQLLKTANWLGPLLVEAGRQGVKAILLFGGKLMKLAGDFTHTTTSRWTPGNPHGSLCPARSPTPVLQAFYQSNC